MMTAVQPPGITGQIDRLSEGTPFATAPGSLKDQPHQYRGWTVRWTGWWLNPRSLVLTSAWFAFKAYRNQDEAARGFLGRKERPKILVSPWPGPVQEVLDGDEYTTEMQPGQRNLAWLSGGTLDVEADLAKTVSRERLFMAIDKREGWSIRTNGVAFIERHHDRELYEYHERAMDRSVLWPDPQSADDGRSGLTIESLWPLIGVLSSPDARPLPGFGPAPTPPVCPGCGAPFHLTAVCPALEALGGPPPIPPEEETGLSGAVAIKYLRDAAKRRAGAAGGDIESGSLPPNVKAAMRSGTWAKGEDRECAACHQRLRSAPWTATETQKRYEADASCYSCGGKDMVPRR